MTTAARPTFLPAMGGFSLRDNNKLASKVVRNLDLNSEGTLKTRQPGQNAPEDVRQRDLRAELMAKEEAHLIAKGLKGPRRPAVEEEPPLSILGKRFEEIDAPDDLAKRQKFLQEIGDLDADDESDSDSNESNEGGQEQESDNEDSDSDDDDDTAELMRELEKIKRERALEKETAERARIESELASKEEEALVGNPLLATGFAVKKRWDEDVIFKNQAKPGAGSGANAGGKRFINDMLRSDFHRKFMNKYVK